MRFEQSVDRLFLAIEFVLDQCSEDTMFAMLAPSLGDDFQLDIGGIAVGLVEVALDSFHVRPRE